MGIITGAFGGVLRDLLINEEPLIFRKDIYAGHVSPGASLLVGRREMGASYMWQGLTCAIVIIGIRILTPALQPVASNPRSRISPKSSTSVIIESDGPQDSSG